MLQHIHRNFSRLDTHGAYTAHDDMTYHDEDAGIWIHAFDYQGLKPLERIFQQSPWQAHLPSLATTANSNIRPSVYDNFPWYLSIYDLSMNNTSIEYMCG
jgi:hypothetical protein